MIVKPEANMSSFLFLKGHMEAEWRENKTRGGQN